MTNLALGETDKSMQQLRHIDLGFVRSFKTHSMQRFEVTVLQTMRRRDTLGKLKVKSNTLETQMIRFYCAFFKVSRVFLFK